MKSIEINRNQEHSRELNKNQLKPIPINKGSKKTDKDKSKDADEMNGNQYQSTRIGRNTTK